MITRGFEDLRADSFLERAFLRWVLTPALDPSAASRVRPQHEVAIGTRNYRLDYAILGKDLRVAIEVDGFEFHHDRRAFTYDRLRQNDLHGDGWIVLRFSYDAIRVATARCVHQLQVTLARDPDLAAFLIANPHIETPDFPLGRLQAMAAPPSIGSRGSIFDEARRVLRWEPLRGCQIQALSAVIQYFSDGGQHAACVMAVGAGKTTLGVAVALACAKRRVLVLTPGRVIRGAFDTAFDIEAPRNSLCGLPDGPLIPGLRSPRVTTLDADDGPIVHARREDLLDAEVIITNFHALGDGDSEGDLLTKLEPGDIDLIIVDEAHIAAADSYQRCFRHFAGARTLLMSACFQRLDGRPIEADVVYRYRLADAIADGHAKPLRIDTFVPDADETVFEIRSSDGTSDEMVGRDALLRILRDERKLAHVTARSDEPIRHVMLIVAARLAEQRTRLTAVRPRILFAALGESHAEQLARIAEAHGIRTETLHHTMPTGTIRALLDRFESESGNLDALVHLRMLGQGYDLPPITIVVPLRPYGSFAEFYQFVGRGIRAIRGANGRAEIPACNQVLDVVCHAELGLDAHLETMRADDFDPLPGDPTDPDGDADPPTAAVGFTIVRHGVDALVVFETGATRTEELHAPLATDRLQEARQDQAMAQQYARYAQTTEAPVPFEQYVRVMRSLRE